MQVIMLKNTKVCTSTMSIAAPPKKMMGPNIFLEKKKEASCADQQE